MLCIPSPVMEVSGRMKTLVVGATGALGRPVVQLLRARDVAVRALSRRAAQADRPGIAGAETMAGDLADPASLARACAGVDRRAGLRPRPARPRPAPLREHRRPRPSCPDRRRPQRRREALRRTSPPTAPGPIIRSTSCAPSTRSSWPLAGSGLDSVVLRPTAFMEHTRISSMARACSRRARRS